MLRPLPAGRQRLAMNSSYGFPLSTGRDARFNPDCMTRVLRRGHLCSFYLSALPACSYERYCARSARSYETYECCIPIAAVAVVAGRRRPARGFAGSRQRPRTRSTTPRACECEITRSPSTNCWTACRALGEAARLKMGVVDAQRNACLSWQPPCARTSSSRVGARRKRNNVDHAKRLPTFAEGCGGYFTGSVRIDPGFKAARPLASAERL